MPGYSLTHLKQLEAESIHIIREVVAEFENPVMLYSIGKDSAVMVRLAEKAFYPAKPPFPLMHVDTTWKFREMYDLRDNYVAKELGLKLIVHVNEEGREKGDQPHHARQQGAHRRDEDRGPEAGPQQIQVRRGLRRRPPRRRKVAGQGAGLLVPRPVPPLGSEEPAARAVEPLQHARSTRAKASASFRSRTGPSSTSGNTSTSKTFRSCRSTSPRSGRSSGATAR